MKISIPFRFLFICVCTALWITQLVAAESPREHLSLDANWKFHLGDDWPDALHLEKFSDSFWRSVNVPHDWQAQPIFDVKKYLHVGDNVIAVGVYNGVAQGGLNPNVNVQIVGHATAAPWSRSLFNGLAQVIVQSKKNAGEIKLTATADGLASVATSVQTKPGTPRPAVP